jgi:hypothetical protein
MDRERYWWGSIRLWSFTWRWNPVSDWAAPISLPSTIHTHKGLHQRRSSYFQRLDQSLHLPCFSLFSFLPIFAPCFLLWSNRLFGFLVMNSDYWLMITIEGLMLRMYLIVRKNDTSILLEIASSSIVSRLEKITGFVQRKDHWHACIINQWIINL